MTQIDQIISDGGGSSGRPQICFISVVGPAGVSQKECIKNEYKYNSYQVPNVLFEDIR